jgi:hypothetical protein
MSMKLSGIISVGFVVTDHCESDFLHSAGTREKNGSTMGRCSCYDFKKACDSVKREVFYNILLEFGVPKKLFRLIKMCLNEPIAKSV